MCLCTLHYIIATVVIMFVSTDCVGEMYDLCILQYSFKFGEYEVKICPHGNARCKSDSYIQKQPSTLKQIKEKQSSTNSMP